MLQTCFEQFKKITLDIIEAVKKEDFDLLDNLIEERQNIINIMQQENYTNEEFRKLALKYGIVQLQDTLNKVMNEKKDYAKQQITNMQQSKKAHKSYNSSFTNKAYFLKEER